MEDDGMTFKDVLLRSFSLHPYQWSAIFICWLVWAFRLGWWAAGL